MARKRFTLEQIITMLRSAVGSLVRNEDLLHRRDKIERENSTAEIHARPQPEAHQ